MGFEHLGLKCESKLFQNSILSGKTYGFWMICHGAAHKWFHDWYLGAGGAGYAYPQQQAWGMSQQHGWRKVVLSFRKRVIGQNTNVMCCNYFIFGIKVMPRDLILRVVSASPMLNLSNSIQATVRRAGWMRQAADWTECNAYHIFSLAINTCSN